MEEKHGSFMTRVLATNIVSPLGYTTEDNFRAVREYRSRLRRYDSWRGIPEPFVASIFDDDERAELAVAHHTMLESVAIRSMEDALSRCDVDVTSSRTLFILSTTKANVDELQTESYRSPGASARKIADYFGFTSEPIVVCNACISGADAQILAHRLLSRGEYDRAVICGVDMVTPFVVAGFLSFKSLSMEECRPFDIERVGLNVGEAAATIVLGRDDSESDASAWYICSGVMSNDAYHLSAPSPKGDGAYRSLSRALEGFDAENLAFINVHGTATMFNDQMESKALERAGLTSLPISALKGYYGHTLGTAGILETIISMAAVDNGVVLGVRGFEEIGVSGNLNIEAKERSTSKRAFLKIISGFGGCNGAMLLAKEQPRLSERVESPEYGVSRRVRLDAQSALLDGEQLPTTAHGAALLTELYKSHVNDYPKFYKMDILSKLVFIASELLLKDGSSTDECSIVLFNKNSSIVADLKHDATIHDSDNFYPSPSLFLYTLPNVAFGEVAIKHGFTGETSLYILDRRDEHTMQQVVESFKATPNVGRIITGWVDCSSEDRFEIDLQILTK